MTDLLKHEMGETIDRSILEQLLHLSQYSLRRRLLDNLALLDRFDSFRASFRDEDFVASHVASRGVVTSVGDSPGVIRDEEKRMEDESDGVVDSLRRGEGVMSACRCRSLATT